MALGGVNVAGVMKSDIKEVQQNINDLIGQTENTGGTVTEGTVMAKLNSLLSHIEKGNGLKIKSLQHGEVAQDRFVSYGMYRFITISPVDINKSILLVNNKHAYQGLIYNGQGIVNFQDSTRIRQKTFNEQSSDNPATYTFNEFVYFILEFE